MPTENSPVNASSNPIGNPTDHTQQDWMELGQQGEAGETLKAKKWTTKRRLVDDASHHGNIHTGTETAAELDKSDTLTGEVLDSQSFGNEERSTQEDTGAEQLSAKSKRESSAASSRDGKEETSILSGTHEERAEAESLVTSGGSDELVFEDHFDDSPSGRTSAPENKSTARVVQPVPIEAPPEAIGQEHDNQETETSSTSEPTLEPVITTETKPSPDPEPEIIIESSASAPLLNVTDSSGLEDTIIAIDISSQLTDTDGSESLTITISGVPEGAFLSAGVNLGNGEWQLTPAQLENLGLMPPANSDEDFSLTVTATSTERHGGQQSSVSEIIDFSIEAVADAPALTASAPQGDEDSAIVLNINATLTDTDGSESLSVITLTGLPEGATLSAGTENPDGSWSLTGQDLQGLTVTPPADSDEDFELQLSVTATDSNGSTATTTSVLPVTVVAVADSPVLKAAAAKGEEDSAISLDISTGLTDIDGSETLSAITFTDVPDGATFSAGTRNSDGSWTIQADQLEGLTITPPENSDVDFTLSLLVEATDTDGVTAATKAFLPVSVSAVADSPILEASEATGDEDTAIQLNITTALTDLDGSETLSAITISDVPDDAILSAGTNNHDGSWTITAEQLNDLTITPPENSADDFTLGLSVTATDTNGVTATTETRLPVTVVAVADAPLFEAAAARGEEDTAIDLDISTSLTDLDGSETLSSVTFTGVPAGAILSAGTYNRDGSWTVTPEELENLQITPPADSDQDFELGLSVTATDGLGVTRTSTASLPVTVVASADTPVLEVADTKGLEDTVIDLDIKSALTDSDGSESLVVTISGVPKGASLSAGTDNQDGTWTLTQDQLDGLQIKPPADSDQDFKLDITAISSEARDSDTAEISATINVTLTAVADAPVLTASAAKGDEDTAIDLDIAATLTDLDGSETLSAITFNNVPKGAALSAGTDNGDGSWTVTAENLEGLQITPPADSDEDFILDLSVTATDTNGVTSTTTVAMPVSVTAAADAPTLRASAATGDEDTAIQLDITAALTDLDGSETLSQITFSNVPDGALLSAGTNNHDGTWSLDADDLTDLSITAPKDSDDDFEIGLSVTATDTNGVTATTETRLPVTVVAVADAPTLEVSAARGDEDTAIQLNITTALTDLDGSEILSAITISDVPDGAILSAGTNNNDGTWSIEAADLAGLTITAPKDSDADFDLSVSVTATDSGGVTSTTKTILPVTVVAVADTPNLAVSDAAGFEDRSIDLDIRSLLTDTDSSESQHITIAGVPEGARLSAGTANRDGSWTLTQDQLEGLQITPPADSDEDFSLSVTATSSEARDGDTASTSATINVAVTAVADAPDLTATAARGDEDQAIALDISAALTDLDGSEVLSQITFSSVPEGAVLSAGTKNSDGSWSVDAADLAGLSITAPKDSDADFELGLSVTATDSQGVTATTTTSFPVTVVAVADTPSLSVSDAAGSEDTAIDLDIRSLLADTDSSESLLITVSGVPKGAELSTGTNNNDGTWTLGQDQLDGLRITPPHNSDTNFDLTVTATSSEARDGDTAETTATISVTVTAAADAPTLRASAATGDEDTAIQLDITAALTDLDGSETLSQITFSNVPDGALLSAGTNNHDGTWSVDAGDLTGLSITAPKDSDDDFEIGLSVTATDTNGVTATTETRLPVTVVAVADAPSVTVEDASGIEDQAIALSIAGATTDIDGSESITSIIVADIPKGAKLSAGTDNGDGTWSLVQDDLSGLTITAPHNSNDDFDLKVTYVSTEPNGSSASTTETISVTVRGVADTPLASFDDLKIAEDQTFSLDFSESLQDTDGSESLSVTFSGIPEGGTFNCGTPNADGTWTIDGKDLDNVQFTPPADSKAPFTLNLVATATENDGDTSSSSDSFRVTIDPLADDASFTVKPAMGLEDTAIDLSIGDLALTDTSGSEIILPDIIISDVPTGAQLSAGIDNHDGTWTLTEDQLTGLQITPPADSNKDFQIKISVSTQETANKDTHTTTKTLDVSVTGVSDNVNLVTQDSTGKEDSSIALSIDTSLIDTDGSESISLVVGNMPNGATLSHGTDNGDGTWTVEGADIAGLTVTPPKHFSGTMDLSITSTATEDDGHSASTSDTITVTVEAVADKAWITGGAKGAEDTTVDLNLRAGLRDKDGSETYGEITLSGVPEGYTISAGTDNGDGSFSLTHAQLDGLSITPPKDSNEDVELTLTVETIDENGSTATISKAVKVDMTGVADAPVAAAQNVSGTEDIAVKLDLDVVGDGFGLTDTDGSETLSVIISNVPEGTVFSAGSDNGDGTWSVAPEDVESLAITPPAHFSGTMNLNLEATATENDGHATTTVVPFSVKVAAVVDAPELSAAKVTGDEDRAIRLDIDSGLVDSDGSESYSLLITGVPEGATLSAGTDNGDGSWTLTEAQVSNLTITPPENSDADFSLKLTATSTETATGESKSISSELPVTVNAVADLADLAVTNARGDEDTAIDLDIRSALTDTDGSESLSITIAGVPEGASLSAGVDNGDGSWTLTPDQLENLQIQPPADSDNDFTLKVRATTTEGENGDQAVSATDLRVTLNAVTDAPDLEVSAAAGDEDTKIALTIDSALTDTDGSETLAILIDDVPGDVRLSAGEKNADGSWTLAPSDLEGLQITLAPDSDSDFTLTVKAVATEKTTGRQTITSQALPVTVNAVADTPLLSVKSVSATEDDTINLHITSSLADSDGSENLEITISGVPDGATLSAGTENPDGSWTLTADQLQDLQLTPPANSDADFDLTVTATATESANADTASQSFSLPVTLFADPDNLQVSLEKAASGDEDTAIALHIDANLTDSDGSEVISITMEGIPAGAALSAGTDNGDGSWTLSLDQLNGLSITPPKDSDQDFNLTLMATTTELANGQEQTTKLDIPVTVTGVADELEFSGLQSTGTEDTAIPIALDIGLQDSDGSESLSITITNIPDGVTLSAGTENTDGSYTLTPEEFSTLTVTPPADSDKDFSLTITATNTEAEGDSRSTTFHHAVNVTADADKPGLTVQQAEGSEDSAIALHINPSLTDSDGSETLSVIIDGLPAGATLSAGTENSDGSWTLSPAELEGLSLTPAADSDADFTLTVTARSTESAGGDTAETTTALPVTVTAVTDTPVLSASAVTGDEDTGISLNIEAALSDSDGSESLSLRIEGVPEGASLSAGTANDDGSWTIEQADIAGLSILPPKDSNENFELTVTAIADEARGDTAQSAPITLPVNVTGVADTPKLEVKGIAGDEDTAIALDIQAGLADSDGSETLSITITGVPEEARLSAGTVNADGSWSLSRDDLADLKIHPPTNSDEDFELSVTATATEDDGDTSSVSYQLPVNVNGVADTPAIEAAAASGAEDSQIALDLSISPVDLDGSEENLDILVKDVPDGAQLSAGINHGDGTWTVAHDAIDDLKITPPKDSADDFTLTFDVRSTEKQSGHSTLTSFVVPVAVAAVADGMLLSADNAYGRTDQDISLNIHHTVLDTDGSETASFVVTDLPEGATLSAGTLNTDGSWSLTAEEISGLKVTPPAGSSEDFSISITGTATEDENGDAISSTISVPVHFRTGGGGGTGTDTISTREDTPVKIDIADRIPEVATAADATVTITGIPADATLSAGVKNSDGSWTVSQAEIADLELTPAEHSGANMLLGFEAELTDEAGATTSQESDLLVTVTDVADAPELSAPAATAPEHTATELNISSSLVDRDGSEQLSITISELPEGATLSAGIDNGDGSWTLEPAQLSGLRITPPRYSDEDFTLKVTATTTEQENGSTASSSFALPVTVTGVADQPLLAVKSGVGDEDRPITLVIDPQLTDQDGSETLSVTISDIPDGALLSAGTLNSDGSYTLTPGQLENLTITPPAQSDQDFDLTITATTVEAASGNTSQSVRSLPVIVNAIADALQVDTAPVSSGEDQAIDLGISATVIDTDGSEVISVVAANVPAGATLSAGTRNADGTWNLTTEQLEGLQVIPPAQSDADFEITFTATTIESENGHTATSVFSVPVTVGAVVDGVAISTGTAAGREDTAIDLDLSAALADQDGSESHVITISNVPEGVILSAGTDNGDGSWTVSPEQVNNLKVIPAANSDEDFSLTLTTSSTESATGETLTASYEIPVSVTAVADRPDLQASSEGGKENEAIALDIKTALTDTDGSEQLGDIVISGVPEGATLSSGTDNGDGSWSLTQEQLDNLTITPPANSDADLSLRITSTSTEAAGDSASATVSLTVNVEAVATNPVVTVTDATGLEDQDIALDISSVLADSDGSESLSIIIGGVPEGARLSAGRPNEDGSWSISQDELEGLSIRPPKDSGDDFDLTISATATELNGDTVTTTATLPVTVQAVADAPKLQLNANAAGREDTAIAIDFSAKLLDTDGSETLTAIIENVPDGAVLSAGTKNADGSWTVEAADISGLSITPPAGSDGNFELKITATATEAEGDTANSSSFTLPVSVEAVADAAVFHSDASGDEDTAIALNLSVNLTDTDGSELMSDILISGMPEGASLSAGEKNLDGSWTVSPDQLDGLQITPPADSGDNFNLNVKVTTTEQASGATTTSQYSLPVEVNAVADAPLITASAVTGDEDSPIALNIATSLTDSDGSETLSALSITGVPEGAVLSAGTNNNDGSWTVPSDQLEGLTLTPPADSHDDFTLTLSTVSTEQDGDSATTSASVNITVTPVNDAPETADDTAATSEDTVLTLQSTDLLANDSDVDGDSLVISAVQDAEHGTVSLHADQSISFTPDENYNGPASFTYTVSDGQGGTETATVQLAISSVNDVPVIEVVDATATEDSSQVVANVSDIDGTIEASSLSAEHGSVSLGENGDITYTPDADYNGTDTVQIEVTDNSGAVNAKSFTVDVAAVNDDPTAADDTGISTAEDTQLTIPADRLLGNDRDVDGDTLSIASVQDAEHGVARVNNDGSVSFTPDANYNGDASFSYTVSDGQGGEDTATVHLKVSAVEDSISIISDTDAAANAVDENTATGTAIGITASATDIDAGSTVSYSLLNDADGRFAIDSESGVITVADGTKLDYEADDLHLISVKATSSDGSSSTKNFAVSVNDINENIAPVAVDDTAVIEPYALPNGGSIVSTAGDSTVVKGEIVAEGDTGSSVDRWTFQHNGGPLTIDTLSESSSAYTDIDGDGEKNHIDTMMRLYDSEGNEVAMNDDSKLGTADGSTNDFYSHNQDSYIQLDDLPPGEYSLAIGSWELTQEEVEAGHNDNYDTTLNYDHVQDTGPYQITLSGKVSFNKAHPLVTEEDSTLTIDGETLLANDSDADGDDLMITAIGDPTDGEGNVVGSTEIITENGKQQVRFIPGDGLDYLNDGESASISFNYTIDDGQGGTDTATATMSVTGVDNDAESPTLSIQLGFGGELPATEEGTERFEYPVTINAATTDQDGSESLSAVTVTVPEGVTRVIDSNGDELSISGGTVSVPVTSGQNTGITLVTDKELDTGEIGSILAEVTSTESTGGATATATAGIDQTIDVAGDINNDTNNVEEGDHIGDLSTGHGDDTVNIGDDIADGRTVSTKDGDDVITVGDDIKEGSTLDTGAGDDTVTVGDDLLNGSTIDTGSGDDRITIGGTADGSVDGGEGEDTIALSGNAADYNIVKNGESSYQVQDANGSRDDILNVSNVEEFAFADSTVAAEDLTLSAKLIDGAVEGVEYTTTSGLHGFTDKDGSFDFKDGDEVTFNIGGVILGTATAEDVATGKTFLQDVADVARTDLNDEYLENMATFLQSIDENSDAYDGIVVTDEIREALADVTLDLKTASEEEVGQVVEQLGQALVSEEAAMEHVADMLVAHTDLDHDDFDEHVDDTSAATEHSLLDEQQKNSLATAAATTGFETVEAETEAEQLYIDEIADLSLNIPSLHLPDTAEDTVQTEETQEVQTATQSSSVQSDYPVQEFSDDTSPQGLVPLADDDLAHSLPSVSLSNLFDEPADDTRDIRDIRDTENLDNPDNTASTATTEETFTTATAVQEAVSQEPQGEAAEGSAVSEGAATNDVDGAETVTLSTDDLHIDLDGDSTGDVPEAAEEKGGDSSLDRFSATGQNAEKGEESSPLDNFSASGQSEETAEFSSVEEIDTMEEDVTDQVDDAGLNDNAAIQEDLPQEPEQIDPNGAG